MKVIQNVGTRQSYTQWTIIVRLRYFHVTSINKLREMLALQPVDYHRTVALFPRNQHQ